MIYINQVKRFILSYLAALRIAALESYYVITNKISEIRKFKAVN